MQVRYAFSGMAQIGDSQTLRKGRGEIACMFSSHRRATRQQFLESHHNIMELSYAIVQQDLNGYHYRD